MIAISAHRPQLLTQDVLATVEALRLAWKIPGLAIGVVRHDGEVETHGWGTENGRGDLVTAETLFGIGSCTKAFTTTVVGLLQGRVAPGAPVLTWKTRIKDILPNDWAMHDRFANDQATLLDILSHQSGLTSHDYMYSPNDTVLSVIRRLRFLLPHSGFREKWQYSNLMYILTAEVIRKYWGDHRLFIENEILAPLQMSSTTFSEQKAEGSGHLSWAWDGFANRQIPYWFTEPDIDFLSAAGGIISNVNDMTKWLKMLLSSLAKDKIDAFPRLAEVVRDNTKARSLSEGTADHPEVSIQGYGLGWYRESYRGHERIHHSGTFPGATARLSLYPEAGIAFIILVNVDDKRDFTRIIEHHIVDRALGLEPIDWPSRWRFQPRSFRKVAERPPPVPMQEYTGTYTDNAYGEITLCLASDTPDTSSSCGRVQATYNTLDSASGTAYTWQLQASWPRIFCSHLRLVSLGDHIFLGQIGTIFPDGYGEDTSPFIAQGFEVAVRFNVDAGEVTGFDFFGRAYAQKEPIDTPTLSAPHAHFAK